jgi:hypothetical protein
MKKIIFTLFSILFINNAYSLDCKGSNFTDFITNKHILKGKLTNKTETIDGSWVTQHFLIDPIIFFTKVTDEKLIVSNFVHKLTIEKSKMSKEELDNHYKVFAYNVSYDSVLDTSKEYYFFVDKNTNQVRNEACSPFIIEESKLTEGYLEHKALSLFNTENYPLIK